MHKRYSINLYFTLQCVQGIILLLKVDGKMINNILRRIITIICIGGVLCSFSGCEYIGVSRKNLEVVTIWSPDGHSKLEMDKIIKRFNETKGKEWGVKIKYEVKLNDLNLLLDEAFKKGNAPDIFYGGDKEALAEAGKIVAFNDLPGGEEFINSYGDYKKNIFYYKDKAYAVPYGQYVRGLIYNKDMFKAAGLVDENGDALPPKTLNEYAEYAKQLTDRRRNQYGIILPIAWKDFYYSDVDSLMDVSGSYFNRQTLSFDYRSAAPIWETFMKIKEDRSYYPGAEKMANDAARACFAEGKIGMKISYSYDVGVLNNQFTAKCDWGVAPLPVLDENNSYCSTGGYKIGPVINSQLVEKIGADKTLKVYEWLMGEEVLKTLYEEGMEIPYSLDIVKSANLENAPKGWQEFVDLASEVYVQPINLVRVDGVNEIFMEVWRCQKTVEQGLIEYTEMANRNFENYCATHPQFDADLLKTVELKKKK